MLKTYYIITKGEKYEQIIGDVKKVKMPFAKFIRTIERCKNG